MKNKHIYITTAAALVAASLNAQSHYTPPEPVAQDCAKDYVFIANDGQLTTSEGEPADGVKYYLQSNSPNLFFQDGVVSFAKLDRSDTSEFAWLRLDMEFICEGEGESGEEP